MMVLILIEERLLLGGDPAQFAVLPFEDIDVHVSVVAGTAGNRLGLLVEFGFCYLVEGVDTVEL